METIKEVLAQRVKFNVSLWQEGPIEKEGSLMIDL